MIKHNKYQGLLHLALGGILALFISGCASTPEPQPEPVVEPEPVSEPAPAPVEEEPEEPQSLYLVLDEKNQEKEEKPAEADDEPKEGSGEPSQPEEDIQLAA